MNESLYGSYPLAIVAGVGSGTTSFPFGRMDHSWAKALRFRLVIATIGVDAGDLYNIYVQARSRDGIWADRVAFPQYLGTATDAEAYDMTIRATESLGSDGEGYEPAGSAGGARLTAGEVVNGPFPGKYHEGGALSYGWRAQIVLTDADADAFLTGTLYVYGLEEI